MPFPAYEAMEGGEGWKDQNSGNVIIDVFNILIF